MRRLVVLAIVSLLGIAPIGIVGRSASAQESSTPQLAGCGQGGSLIEYPAGDSRSLPWMEVCKPIHNAEDATNTAPYQPYTVEFTAQYSATEVIGDGTEDQRTAEFMIVRVTQGSFAIDLETDEETDEQGNVQQVVVSTAQDHIETLNPYENDPPHYTPNGASLMFNGEVCTQGCPVDPDVPVLLVPGDIAVAEKGALCIYCLLHGSTGLLEVFVLPDPGVDDPQEFTWIDSWDAAKDAWDAETATPSASTEPVVMAWAFFNPGRCDH